MEKEYKFKRNDLVKFKQLESPIMKVDDNIEIIDRKGYYDFAVCCCWFDKNHAYHEEKFGEDELELVE